MYARRRADGNLPNPSGAGIIPSANANFSAKVSVVDYSFSQQSNRPLYRDNLSNQRKMSMLSITLPNVFRLLNLRGIRTLHHLGAIVLSVAVLAACANRSVKPAPEQTPAAPELPAYVFDRPFNSDTLYALLVAEIAGERQRFDVMLSNYVQQAEATDDPLVTARAARLARYLNAHETALKMARHWLSLEPENPEAHFIAAAELVQANQLLDAVSHAEFLLEHGETSGLDAIAARAQQSQDPEKSADLLREYQRLLAENPQQPVLLIGASLLYQDVGELEQALSHAQAAAALEPDDFQAAAQETRVLQQLGRHEQAREKLSQLVARHPTNAHLRLQYARVLLKTDLAAAQKQFEKLLTESPDDSDLTMTVALIELERQQLDAAKSRFQILLNSDRHRSSAHYYLGRIAASQNDRTGAIDHFSKVGPGSDYLPALSQMAELMAAAGEQQAALDLVRQKRGKTPASLSDQVEGLFLLEAHVLSNQNQLAEALTPLQQGLEQFPDSTKLLYTRAMLFARMDDLPRAEADFKKVLALKPDNAAALNALGYTLADRTDRLEEAYQYIREAYRLAPDDPAIIDSLGWIEYLRGNHEAALKNLRNAMELMPDHEIAAHLGEVLWVSGNKREAQQVWQRGLQLQPDSPIILDTIKRLRARP